jgi:hypothetical protein
MSYSQTQHQHAKLLGVDTGNTSDRNLLLRHKRLAPTPRASLLARLVTSNLLNEAASLTVLLHTQIVGAEELTVTKVNYMSSSSQAFGDPRLLQVLVLVLGHCTHMLPRDLLRLIANRAVTRDRESHFDRHKHVAVLLKLA